MYRREAQKIARQGNGILLENYQASHYVTMSGTLVVSEVCARKYGPRKARERSTRGQERLVDGFAADATVGMAELQELQPLAFRPLSVSLIV